MESDELSNHNPESQAIQTLLFQDERGVCGRFSFFVCLQNYFETGIQDLREAWNFPFDYERD